MKSKKLFIVVQEGGSSSEYYIHAHDTLNEANKDRKGCAEASYRTSKPIEVPTALAKVLLENDPAESAFLEVLETVLRAPLN